LIQKIFIFFVEYSKKNTIFVAYIHFEKENMQNVEQKLIKELISGDKTAFDFLFKSHHSVMVRIANDILRDVGLAEEVVQDVFVKLWKNSSILSIDNSLNAYLVTMVRNRCIDCLRAKARRIKTISIDHPDVQAQLHKAGMDATFDEEFFPSPLEIAFQQALEQLPQQCRQIFLLNRIDGYSHKEIADMKKISVSAVKAQITRALQKITNFLQPFLKKKSYLCSLNHKKKRLYTIPNQFRQ